LLNESKQKLDQIYISHFKYYWSLQKFVELKHVKTNLNQLKPSKLDFEEEIEAKILLKIK
jgi:hypothetical protein